MKDAAFISAVFDWLSAISLRAILIIKIQVKSKDSVFAAVPPDVRRRLRLAVMVSPNSLRLRLI
jgi:hypothetical protein